MLKTCANEENKKKKTLEVQLSDDEIDCTIGDASELMHCR